MRTYVTSELPALVEKEFNISATERSIFGHSMGGHGGRYRLLGTKVPILVVFI
jgi:S-formylglutathione hydrolase FrmB